MDLFFLKYARITCGTSFQIQVRHVNANSDNLKCPFTAICWNHFQGIYVSIDNVANLYPGQLVIYAGEGKDGQVLFTDGRK